MTDYKKGSIGERDAIESKNIRHNLLGKVSETTSDVHFIYIPGLIQYERSHCELTTSHPPPSYNAFEN